MRSRSETVHGPINLWLVVFPPGGPQRAIEVTTHDFVIGRDESCDLVIDDERVSRRHAIIRAGRGPGRLLIDVSSNGTLVNGQPIRKPTGFARTTEPSAELFGGEVLQVGPTRVLVTLQDPSSMIDDPTAGVHPAAEQPQT